MRDGFLWSHTFSEYYKNSRKLDFLISSLLLNFHSVAFEGKHDKSSNYSNKVRAPDFRQSWKVENNACRAVLPDENAGLWAKPFLFNFDPVFSLPRTCLHWRKKDGKSHFSFIERPIIMIYQIQVRQTECIESLFSKHTLQETKLKKKLTVADYILKVVKGLKESVSCGNFNSYAPQSN